MMPIRVHSASHSSMLCVVSTIERSVRSRMMISHICRRLTGSIPLEGSSRKTTAGEPTSAIAKESLRLLPPEYEPQTRSAYGVSVTCESAEHTERVRKRGVRWGTCALLS